MNSLDGIGNDIFESDLTPRSKLVMIYLVLKSNSQSVVKISKNQLIEDCQYTKPTILKAISELEEKGWVQKVNIQNGRRGCHEYRIKNPKIVVA